MRSAPVVRVLTLLLAWAHTFPASKHLALFVASPSIGEAWKGLGAALAVGLYLLPPRVQARALASLYRERRAWLAVAGWLLAAAHAVPALDHLPRCFASPSWADGWRGFGAAFAAFWLAAPVPVQARVLAALRRTIDVPLPIARSRSRAG